jgi:ATP-dependent Clp protease ATP-binding subunit ClpA
VLADIKPLDEWAKAVTAATTPAPARRVRGRLPFTPQAREAVARASVEAAKLGHPFIGTEHQLLALINVGGVASRVLVDGGATDERVRDDIVKLLGNALPSRAQAPTQPVDGADPGEA